MKASEEAGAKANARLKEIETEYNTQYDAKTDKCDAINNDMRATDRYTKLFTHSEYIQHLLNNNLK